MEASPATAEIIRTNWQRVQADVADACSAAGRAVSEVRIVGVSKYVGPELTQQLVDAGCRDLGENRPQALWAKHDWFNDAQPPQAADGPVAWHMIGHLQRNKIRRTLPLIDYLHSVDSLRLVDALATETANQDRRLPILVEVNVTEDATKTGMDPSGLPELFERIGDCPHLILRGLMAMSTNFSGGDQARHEFARVRQLRDTLQSRYPELDCSQLSMGMSGDFREAILEGATLVRIGSHLWDGIPH